MHKYLIEVIFKSYVYHKDALENDIDIKYAKQKHALVLNWYVFIVLSFTAHVYWKDLWLYEIQSEFKFYQYMYFMKTDKGTSWQSGKGASWQSGKKHHDS